MVIDMNIRRAQIKDAQRIAELLKAIALLHHDGRPDIYEDSAKYDIESVKEMIDDKTKYIFTAVDENDFVMGYIICFVIERRFQSANGLNNTMYIDDLCVDENYRHQGIGEKLVAAAKDNAKAQGCYNLELNVWSFNKNAVKFYENCGMYEQRRRMEIIL